MRTVVLGDPPVEIERLIALRRATGADRWDEVWKGDYHMAPSPRLSHARLDSAIAVIMQPYADRRGLENLGEFNLGRENDYRIPDRGLLRPGQSGVYATTAALVIEILSPDDETFEKLPFYAAYGVDEVMIVDPVQRSAEWLRLADGAYETTEHSEVLAVDVTDVAAQITWPPAGD